jgi:cell division protein FtsQ
MAARQARRRKQSKKPIVVLPKIRIGRIATPLLVTVAAYAVYQFSLAMLDREISSVEISGPFQRVSALLLEQAISDEIDAGFVGADLDKIHQQIVALPWIDRARVARRWPSRLEIAVTEQVPAAVWGERGLLNTRGELFVAAVRHVPSELPRLSGPDERSAGRVAARYLSVREQLIPLGLDLRRVHLDERGSWEMTLQNGIEIRLGRKQVAARTDLFLHVVADIIVNRAVDIEYIDMRYGNGFTIGCKGEPDSPVKDKNTTLREIHAARGPE